MIWSEFHLDGHSWPCSWPQCNLCVVGSAMLPSKVLYITGAKKKKIYQSQPSRDHALSSVAMFQMHQAMCLAEVGKSFPPESPLIGLLNEVKNAHSLLVSCCAVLSLGRGMPSTVMAQRHLSPVLSGLSIWTSLCRPMFVWTITKCHPGEV